MSDINELLAEEEHRDMVRREVYAWQLDQLARRQARRVVNGQADYDAAWKIVEDFAYAYRDDCPVPLGILHKVHAKEIATEAWEEVLQRRGSHPSIVAPHVKAFERKRK